MAFLVGPGDAIDAKPGESGVGGEGARQLQRVDDAERAVEPAAPGLRLAVRADQQVPLRDVVAAEDIADPVDLGDQSGLGEFLGEPMARGHVDFRIGRAVDPGVVAAEFGEPPQVGDDAGSVNSWHDRGNLQRINLASGEAPPTSCVFYPELPRLRNSPTEPAALTIVEPFRPRSPVGLWDMAFDFHMENTDEQIDVVRRRDDRGSSGCRPGHCLVGHARADAGPGAS